VPRAPAGGNPARCAVVLGCSAVAIARSVPVRRVACRRSRRSATRCAACRWSSRSSRSPRGAAGRDVQRLRAELVQPLAQLHRHHLRAVVRADVLGDSALDHHVGEDVDHVVRADAPRRHDRQRLLRVLVDQREDFERPQPHTRSVGQPEPSALRLLRRHFQPLLLPDPLDPRPAHIPAFLPQQARHLPIAIPAVLRGEGNDRDWRSGGSSALGCGTYLTTDLAMPSALQIRRSEYACFERTRATASRQRTGLSSSLGDFSAG